jgi:hypothetical protein
MEIFSMDEEYSYPSRVPANVLRDVVDAIMNQVFSLAPRIPFSVR